MQNAVKAITVLIALVALLLLALVATQVGGIAIRSVGTRLRISLELSQPVIRGEPVVAHWVGDDPAGATTGQLLWRDTTSQRVLGDVVLSAQQGEVVFPCDTAADTGTLMLLSKTTRETLA